MKHILLSAFFLFSLFTCLYAQQADTLTAEELQMQVLKAQRDSFVQDSIRTVRYMHLAVHSPLLVDSGKTVISNVQQMAKPKSNAAVFVLLVVLLLALTYVKVAFGNDMQEMLQAFTNRNIAMQIFRTQSNEITFSSILLHFNFIIVFSMYVRFILVWKYHVVSLERVSTILFFIFLFTFFYLGKLFTVKLLGWVFEVNEEAEEYIYHFSIVCKTLGLALIPTLFVFYAAPTVFFNFIFWLSNLFVAVFVIVFTLRGLSTGYKLMYRSAYHFFIYVCVVEISPIFLLFKLLTKTVV